MECHGHLATIAESLIQDFVFHVIVRSYSSWKKPKFLHACMGRTNSMRCESRTGSNSFHKVQVREPHTLASGNPVVTVA